MVEDMVLVVEMGTVGAVAAIFGAMVLVLVPAGLVHRVLALHHHLFAFFEGSLAQVAGLCDRLVADDHFTAGMANHVFLQEHPVTDVWHNELTDDIDQQHKKQPDAYAFEDNLA